MSTIERLRLTNHGISRSYTLLEPEHPDGRLFIWLHGSTQSGSVARRFTDNSFDTFAEAGVRVIYPDGFARHWNDGRVQLPEATREQGIDDVAFLEHLVDLHGERGCGARIAGYSNGGQMALRMLHDRPGLFAGAAVLAATQPAPTNFLCTNEGYEPTPILFMHGTADPMVPFEGGVSSPSGVDPARARGESLSFGETLKYYAALNGTALADPVVEARSQPDLIRTRYEGTAPVEGWALDGVGHVVPAHNTVTSALLGPGCSGLVAAEVIWDFLFD